jgi:hypothetical protein
MAGHYRNEAESHTQTLRDWIQDSIREKRWEHHNDLHIDQLDPFYCNKKVWVEGAIALWKIALKNIPSPQHTVMLSIPLALQSKPCNPRQVTESYMKSQLGQTPPSICVYPTNFEIYNEFAKKYPEIRINDLPNGFACYFEQREIELYVYFQCLFFKLENERFASQ